MKVIDVINKIANDEIKDGTKFIFNSYSGFYNGKTKRLYLNINGTVDLIRYYGLKILNDEIEIIEDCPNNLKKINWKEKESLAGNFTEKQKMEILARRSERLKKSLNEVIDYINKLESEKQNETK